MKESTLLQNEIKVICIGVNVFYDALRSQLVEAIQLEWVPPAEGDQETLDILDKLL